MNGIEDDVLRIERERGKDAKSLILKLCSVISFTGGTRDERIGAVSLLNTWLDYERKQNRVYNGLNEFMTYQESKLGIKER